MSEITKKINEVLNEDYKEENVNQVLSRLDDSQKCLNNLVDELTYLKDFMEIKNKKTPFTKEDKLKYDIIISLLKNTNQYYINLVNAYKLLE